MAYAKHNTKDYSDDWDAFEAGLKAKSSLDLTYYARNLVSTASRIDGDDDFANALFEKLTKRARLVNAELNRRGSYNAPRTTPEERKRRIEELVSALPETVTSGLALPNPRGASYTDPPIPTRVTALLPVAQRSSPSAGGESIVNSPLKCDEDLEDTEPYELTPSPYKKFKVSFEEEDK